MATLPILYSRSIKLEKLCRLCLSKDTVLQSIFDVHFGVTSLDYVITTLTGVKIDERDGLPTSVCNSCTDKASIAYDLKKLVLESQAFLQDIVKKEKSEKLDYSNALQNEILKVKEEQACSYDDFDGDYAEMSLDDFNDADHIKVEIEAIGKSMAPTSHLKCHICLKQLESDLALITHLKSCSTAPEDVVVESGSYCPLCGTCYNSCANLTKHMWDKHAELMGPKKRGRPRNIKTSTILNRLSGNGVCIKPVMLEKDSYILECSICKKLFKNNDELKEHILSHKDTKLYSCLVCKKMYLRLSKFKAHPCFQSHNSKSGDDASTAMEEYDKKSFLKEDTFRSMMDNIAMPQVCRLCSEVFDVTVEMSSHIDSQHPEASKRCNICTKLFSSVKSAVRHRKSCKKIEKKYKCNTCGLKFPFEISLNKHILRHHEGESVSTNFIDPVLKEAAKKFQCDTCKKLFARKVTLAVHTRLHTITKTFQCDVCHREFNRKDNMKQHRRTHEQRAPKPHTSLCLYCGRSFNNSSNLIVHMRRHTGEKPYKCDFCAKGFPRSSDLVMHRRSHTGEKPCQCKVCGKAFSRSNKLTRHMRVHTGHKPYKCTYCEKAFAQSNDLTLHIRRHTGDKPYICEVCGDRFIQGTALQNHRRAHGHFPATAPPPSIFDPGLMQTSKNNASILRLPMGGPLPMYPLSHSGL